MLQFVAPMKANPAKETELPTGTDWCFEIKWDGMRAIVAAEPGAEPALRIFSGNGIDATSRFPELEPLVAAVHARSALLDGEIVAFDATGHPSFELMQTRMHISDRRDAARRAQSTPVTLILFDLLSIDGTDITSLPLARRREALEAVVDPGAHWQLSPITDDGAALLQGVAGRGLEGVVAKRRDSPYLAGQRTNQWRKIKLRRHDEFVVGGWHEGERGRQGSIGGLLIGYYDENGHLCFAGQVGSGLTETEIGVLTDIFERTAIDTSPFGGDGVPRQFARAARWVEPTLVIEVAYAEWTREGRVRHPSYLGRRFDKPAHEVGSPRV